MALGLARIEAHYFRHDIFLPKDFLLSIHGEAGYIHPLQSDFGPGRDAIRLSDRFFGALSDRLTMQNGVLLMGGSSILALLYTRGDITTLVTLYAINVFVTFSLSQLAMCRFWLRERQARKKNRKRR